MSDGNRDHDTPLRRLKTGLTVLGVTIAVLLAISLVSGHYAPHNGHAADQAQAAPQKLLTQAQVGSTPKTEGSNPSSQKAKNEGVGWGTWPDWAIVLFTLALTILGWLQYRLDKRTAAETKDALDIGRRGANAAELSASVARSALMLTQRARLSLLIVNHNQFQSPTDPRRSGSYHFRARFKNNGPTRALNLKPAVEIRVFPTGQVGDLTAPTIPAEVPDGFHLEGGAEFGTGPVVVRPDQFAEGNHVYIVGRVEYEDVFSGTMEERTVRTLTFASEIIPETDVTLWPHRPGARLFRMVPHADYNRSD